MSEYKELIYRHVTSQVLKLGGFPVVVEGRVGATARQWSLIDGEARLAASRLARAERQIRIQGGMLANAPKVGDMPMNETGYGDG